MRVLALGGYGIFGRDVAKRLSASNLVTEIVIAGRSMEAAKKAADELGDKAMPARVDALDESDIMRTAQGADLLVNIAGPDYIVSYPAARAAIRTGAHYCDLCADVSATERILELDHDAKEQDVSVLLGMGASPGQTNLMMKHACSQFDNVEDVRTLLTYNLFEMMSHMSANSPAQIASEMRRTGRVNASWETVMNWGGGRVLVHEKGNAVEVDPLRCLEDIQLPGEGTSTFFPIGCPEALTIPHFVRNVDSASYMMSVSPPPMSSIYMNLINRMRRKDINAAEATILFHEDVAKRQTEETDTSSWPEPKSDFVAVAIGDKDGDRVRYSCRPVSGWVSASTTLSVAALKILQGEVKERGVLAPEACFDPVPFMKELVSNVPGRQKDGPILEETIERLA